MSGVLTPEVIAAARQAVERGQMTVTLVATEGSRFRLIDLGKLCTGMDRLMRTITKEVAPDGRVEWCITGLGLANDNLSVTFGAFTPPKRSRAKRSSR